MPRPPFGGTRRGGAPSTTPRVSRRRRYRVAWPALKVAAYAGADRPANVRPRPADATSTSASEPSALDVAMRRFTWPQDSPL